MEDTTEDMFAEYFKCKVCEFSTTSVAHIRDHIDLAHKSLLEEPVAQNKSDAVSDTPESDPHLEQAEEVEDSDPEEVTDHGLSGGWDVSDSDREDYEPPPKVAVKKVAKKVPTRRSFQAKCPKCSRQMKKPSMKNHFILSHNFSEARADQLVQQLAAMSDLEPATKSAKRGRAGKKPAAPQEEDSGSDKEDSEQAVQVQQPTPKELKASIPEVGCEDPGTLCPYCDKDYHSFDSLKAHIMNTHKPKLCVPCPCCEKSIRDNALAKHLRLQHLEPKQMAKCNYAECQFFCRWAEGETYRWKRRIMRHLIEEHQLSQADAETNANKWVAGKAMEIKEDDEDADIVDWWSFLAAKGFDPQNKTAQDVADMVISQAVPKEDRITLEDMMPWLTVCPVCRAKFDTVVAKELHLTSHKSGAKLPKNLNQYTLKQTKMGFVIKCPDCPVPAEAEEFNTMEELEAHCRSEHYEKDYVCEICDKVLPTFNLFFHQHLRDHCRHDSVGLPICPWCDKSMGNTNSKRKANKKNFDHMSTHIPPKYWSDELTCPICKRRVYRPAMLEYHMKNDHPKEPPKAPCNLCKMVFARKEYLARHMKQRHSGVK